MRTGNDAFIADCKSRFISPCFLVEAHFRGSVVYCWTGLQPITWNGHTWIGVGNMGSISTMEESGTVEAKGITLTFSGFDATLLADVMGEFQVALPCVVYFGSLDPATGGLKGSPLVSWAGNMDQPTINVDGQTATIEINCESELIDLNTAIDRRYTSDDQQLDYPGDKGFDFVPTIQEVQIYWGRVPWDR